LKLFHPATVTGRVVTADGTPVPDVTVRLAGLRMGMPELIAGDVRTDVRGEFRMARVYPGPYVRYLWLNHCADPFRHLSRPVPPILKNIAGEMRLPDAVLGAGSGTISGRVVDQDGKPFPDLWVVVHPEGYTLNALLGDTQTDALGAFTFTKLPLCEVHVDVEPYGFHLYRKGNKLAAMTDRVNLDLGATPEVQLPVITAIENRPFVVRGRIQTDDLHGLEVERRVMVTNRRNTPPYEDMVPLEIGENGAFVWSFDAPCPDIKIWIRGPLGVREYRFVTVPGTERVEVLHYP